MNPGAITIATAPCSWGVWYADGSPADTPWSVFLDQAAEAGYESLELGPEGYLPVEAERLRQELAARKLSVCAGTACYPFVEHRTLGELRAPLDGLCRRIAALGGRYLVTMDGSDVGPHSSRKRDYGAETWDRSLALIREMGRYTRDAYGIETVFHPHVKTLIEGEEEILRLFDTSDLNLCFDTGHHAYANGGAERGGEEVLRFIRNHADRIKYLHFKNVEGKIKRQVEEEGLDSDSAFDRGVMCALEEGIIDFRELKRVLEEIRFRGIGVIETDVPKSGAGGAFALARRNLEYLRHIGMIG